VIRRATPDRKPVAREVPYSLLVPGEIIRLSSGDLVPADCRLITAKDLYVSEAC
jgi:P-type Mg2+ transporter